MTLAERLLAIQAEYSSAIAEAAALKRQAAAKSPELQDALERARNAGETPDFLERTEQLADEIARLRDRADAISERGSELKAQIAEIEAHLGQGADSGEAGLLARIQTVRQTIMRLRQAEQGQPDAASAEAHDELLALQRTMEQLRADYLRNRIEALANDYLATAHQLVEMGEQLMALCGIAADYGNPVELQLRNLEIPLPSGNLASRWGFAEENLRLDDQHIRAVQTALDSQLATILR